jgi:hypothetical protein
MGRILIVIEPFTERAGEPQLRLSRTLDDAAYSRSSNIVPTLSRYAALPTLALSRTKPARPYICRLIIFSRFT